MSHKNKKSLIVQMENRLNHYKSFGRKKYIDKANAREEWERTHGDDGKEKAEYIRRRTLPYIYSESTYKNYHKHLCYYIKWCEQTHGCKTLKECRQYANEWLQIREASGLSPWTIKLERSALGKLYQEPTTNFVITPERHRANIKRSRTVTAARTKFEKSKKNRELIAFCKSTGLRRKELETLKPEQLEITPKGRILNIKGKGGRERQAPIIGENRAAVVAKIQATPAGQKVWGKVNKNAPIHSYRADYRTAYYKQLARHIQAIKAENRRSGRNINTGIYYCRDDRKHTTFDRRAMAIVSKALGHTRLDVVAGHYLR